MLLFLVTSLLQPEQFVEDDISDWESQYYVRTELANCYATNNELQVNYDAQQFCVVLQSQQNALCEKLPSGVYLDLQLSNLAGYILRFKQEHFNYANTTQICGKCATQEVISIASGTNTAQVLENDACSLIQQTESAKATIRSLTLSTAVRIGRIALQHSDLNECFLLAGNTISIGDSAINMQFQSSGTCEQIMAEQAISEVNLTFTDFDAKILNFDLLASNYNILTYFSGDYFCVNITEQSMSTHTLSLTSAMMSDLASVSVIFTLSSVLSDQIATSCTIFRNIDIPRLFKENSSELQIWGEKIIILTENDANALQFQEKLEESNVIQQIVNIRIIQNDTGTSVFQNSFKYNYAFNFSNTEKLTYYCKEADNSSKCLLQLSQLYKYDYNALEITVEVANYAADSKFISKIFDDVDKIQDSCWNSIDLILYQNKICTEFSKNEQDKSCIYQSARNATVTLSMQDIFQQTKDIDNYQIDQAEVCFDCSSQKCNSLKLKNVNDIKDDISFVFVDKQSQQQYEIALNNIYSQNYKALWIQLKLLSIYLAVIIFIIVLFNILIDIGICHQNKTVVKEVKQIDDM